MNIYLAARYTRRDELCEYRTELEAAGHTVTSRWLNGDHQINDDGLSAEGTHQERIRFANEDYDDLISADLLIAFTEPPRSKSTRGGRHVEFGIALGVGMSVVVVGPRENVFYCLEDVTVYEAWQDCVFGEGL